MPEPRKDLTFGALATSSDRPIQAGAVFASRRLSLVAVTESNGVETAAVQSSKGGSSTPFDMAGLGMSATAMAAIGQPQVNSMRSGPSGSNLFGHGAVVDEVLEENDDDDEDIGLFIPSRQESEMEKNIRKSEKINSVYRESRSSSVDIPLPMSPSWMEVSGKPLFESGEDRDGGEDEGSGPRSSTSSTQPRSSNEDTSVYPPRITRESVDNILGASIVVLNKRGQNSKGSTLWDRARGSAASGTLARRVPRSPQLGRKASRSVRAATMGPGSSMSLAIPRHMSLKPRRKSFFDVALEAGKDHAAAESGGEQDPVVSDCVKVLESLSEHLWAAEKKASKSKDASQPPGVHTVETLEAAMDLSPIDKLRWCIYKIEHNFNDKGNCRESNVDHINRLFQSKVTSMGEDGDGEDARISAFIQQTFLGKESQVRKVSAAVDAFRSPRSCSEPTVPHGKSMSLDMVGHPTIDIAGDGNQVARALSLRGVKGENLENQPNDSRRRPSLNKGYVHHQVGRRRTVAGSADATIGETTSTAEVTAAWMSKRWRKLSQRANAEAEPHEAKPKRLPSKHIEAGRLVFSAEAEKMLSSVGTWGLNLFTLDAVTSGRPLVAIGLRCIETFRLYENLKIDPLLCAKFFTAVENGYGKYPEVPYHNYLHGADVLHTTFALLQDPALKGAFTDLEILAALLAAAAHDIGHPGVNNSFMVNTSHETAILYNDASVLENFHTATVFQLMGKDEYNVLGSLSDEDAKQVRRLMIGMILGTDMAKHVTHLADFRECMSDRQEEVARLSEEAEVAAAEADADGSALGTPLIRPKALPSMNDKQRVTLLEAIVHLSDLSGATKPWESCRIWSARVLKEFIDQGYKEAELGIPVEPLNDGSQTNVGRGQKGFIAYVVAPLWEIWEDFVTAGEPEGTTCEPMEMLSQNLDQWEEIIKSGDVTGHEFVADVLKLPSDDSAVSSIHTRRRISVLEPDPSLLNSEAPDGDEDAGDSENYLPSRKESQHGQHEDGVHSNDEASDHHSEDDGSDGDESPRMFKRSHSWDGV